MTQWEELTEVTWALSAGSRDPGTSPVSDVVGLSAGDHGDPFLCICLGSSLDSRQLQLAGQRGHLFLHLLSNHAETSRASSPGSGCGGPPHRRTRVVFTPTPRCTVQPCLLIILPLVSSQPPAHWAGQQDGASSAFSPGLSVHLSLASRVPEAQILHVWAQLFDGDGRL